MKLYNYDHNGRYTGQSIADESPLEPGVYLVPAHATPKSPPVTVSHEAALFDGTYWHIVSDYVGTVYWLADGSRHEIVELGVMPPADALFSPPEIKPVPVKITVVTMRQARLSLLDAGLLDDVERVIAGAGPAAKIEWDYAHEVHRDNPLIAVVQAQQGMSDAQIDALFERAATL